MFNVLLLVIAAIIKLAVFIPLFLIKEASFFGYEITDIFWSKNSKILKLPSLPSPSLEATAEDESNNSSQSKGSFLFKASKYINKKMDRGFYFALLKSMEIDIFLTSWATMKSLGYLTIWSNLSNSVLMFFFTNNIIYTILTVRIFYIHIFPKKMNKIKQKKG